MFGLPKRELDKKFTKSEMFILAWRSQEVSASLKENMSDGEFKGERTKGKKRVEDPSIPEGLPDRFFDENGEVNLSRVSGEDAWRYMNMVGMRLPTFNR